jgi:Novel STAND NTPase 1/TIR domain
MSLLFLSHAGADTDAARALKGRIEKAPQSKAADLKVWFDKDDLKPGMPWQDQLAEVINDKVRAFAVYIGSKGVVNWVEAEVRLGLSRAISGGKRFPFIPIISKDSAGSSALPGFARQFHAVRDVENDEAEFKKLLAAILEVDAVGSIVVEDEPFFGLQAIDEKRSHLFFGRDQEVRALSQALRDETLVLVAGDSGSGKSSLVRAGLIPKWRGGYVGELEGKGSRDDTVWHVVVMRPQAKPRRGLAEGWSRRRQRSGSVLLIATLWRPSRKLATASRSAGRFAVGSIPRKLAPCWWSISSRSW